MVLNQPIEFLGATRTITLKRFKALRVTTFFDLISYLPTRHIDYGTKSSIKELQEGEKVTIKGRIIDVKNRFVKGRLSIQTAIVEDDTGQVKIVWFNQLYLLKLLNIGSYISVAGEVKKYNKNLIFSPREFEILRTPQQETLHTARLVPIYPEKRGLSSRTIREKVFYVLKNYFSSFNDELLPEDIRESHTLIELKKAYQSIHFPHNREELDTARRRLSFDELFVIQLRAQLVRKKWEKEKVGHLLEVNKFQDRIDEFIKNLDFSLTDDQKKVVSAILKDLNQPAPMNRFLQGDVGSGKTVVAAIASYLTALNRFQTLFMAPTEILAMQHYYTLQKLFPNASRIAILTGSKKTLKEDLKQASVIIGTHALLNKDIELKNVGLVIIDEQQRFGVKQRGMLKEKGINPHLLTMTATPIPRTVALTLYGELDISVIEEMPKGRIPIKTFLVPQEKRKKAYEWIKQRIEEDGAQVFIICPLIEESEKETMKSVKAAKKEYEFLRTKVFPNQRLNLLHGKVKSKEKEEIMKKFHNKEYDILVATSVVEVGIDIPDATIIVIEGAERYGLAQLHQLRGRVGRETKQSYCLLFTDTEIPSIVDRLKFFATHSKGNEIAAYDLERRGPGEVYGTQQHGYSDIQIASLSDYALIEESKQAVSYFFSHYELKDAPALLQKKLEGDQIDLISRD